jgi:ATP-dependent exoDNAse (exonuclease V) alpha subunit
MSETVNQYSEDDHSTYFNIELTAQQKEAFLSLQSFAVNKHERVFILNGYAGTGKTTLLNGFVRWLQQSNMPFELLASTGRAARVLLDKTGNPARTVHGLVYTYAGLDEDVEEMAAFQHQLDRTDKGQINLLFTPVVAETDATIVYIVDEASMISDVPSEGSSFAVFGKGRLLYDLFNYDKNGKFIFVGDPCQLPPVNEPFSPALSKAYLEKTYQYSVQHYELTDILRQDLNNGIIAASMILRDQKRQDPDVRFASFYLKGYVNITLHASHAALLDEYIHTLKEYGVEYTTLICQKNAYCSHFNNIVRAAMGRSENTIECGDVVMVTQNNNLVDLYNGDLVEVVNIGSREYRANLSFLHVEVKRLTSEKRFSTLLIENVLTSSMTNITPKQNTDLIIDFAMRMKKMGINQKSQAFESSMNEDPFLNAMRAVYGYAITCHKGQGGEWDEVFLYLDNKIQGIQRPMVYQWVYTAVTRAKKRLHAVNDWYIK